MTLPFAELLTPLAMLGILAPFVIVGTGVLLGLTISVARLCAGIVISFLELLYGVEEEEERK